MMMNNLNRNSSIEDFVWDDDFREWVLHKNEHLDAYWNDWIATYPDRATDLMLAKQIVKSMSAKNIPVSDHEMDDSIQYILQQIDKTDAKVENKPKLKRVSWLKYAAAAAILLPIVGVLMFFLKHNDSSSAYNDLVKTFGDQLTEKVNTGAGPVEVILEDGTKITLEKGSKISYPLPFNNFSARKIYLDGKAKFEVARNPKKPFFVYTNDLVTRVLGTKFTITSNSGDKNTTVDVISGIVAVFPFADSKSPENGNTRKADHLILTRNQKASYLKTSKTLTASIVEQPVSIDDKPFDYVYADKPLKKVFQSIEDGYGIKIIYDAQTLSDKTFTADMSKTSMYKKLNIICKTINAHYQVVDGKIIIQVN